MDETLLAILCCPLTHQTLQRADSATLERVRTSGRQGISEALLRADGLVVYPVVNGIPVLVPEEAIDLGLTAG